MKKNNIEAIAVAILASNPKLKEVFMTSDGQGFTTEEIAEKHQKTLGEVVAIVSYKAVAKKAAKTESILDLSVAKLTAAIKEEKDVAILTNLLAGENAKGEDVRTSAVKAIQDRLDAISAETEDNK